MNLYEGMEV